MITNRRKATLSKQYRFVLTSKHGVDGAAASQSVEGFQSTLHWCRGWKARILRIMRDEPGMAGADDVACAWSEPLAALRLSSWIEGGTTFVRRSLGAV